MTSNAPASARRGQSPLLRGAAANAAALGAAAIWAQPLVGCKVWGLAALPLALGAAALAVVAEQCLLLAGADARAAPPPNASVPLSFRLPQVLLGILATAGLARMFFAPPPEMPFARFAGFQGLAALSSIFLSAYVCLHLRGSFRKARFGFLLATFAAMGFAAGMTPLEVACGVAAAILLRVVGGTTGELAALVVLFPLPSGIVALAVVLLPLVALRRMRLLPVIAAAAGAGFSAAALLGSSTACASPAIGIGLLGCAAAAAAPQQP
ncbi:MAG: hypothetical protein ACJ78W_03020 [Myxococcales bacterium]